MISSRLAWQREVSRTAFEVGMRPVKATLLSIAPLITVDGRLEVWRDQLVEAAGVPPRTIDRHVDKAINAGWLRRMTPGGYKRRPVYVVTVPTCASCAPTMARSAPVLCAMCSAQDSESCAPRCGELKEDTASVSEHGVVHDHDGTADGDADGTARLVDRYGTAASTQWRRARLVRVVGAPHDHGSADAHDLTARLRAAGVHRGRPAFAWKGAAA